MNPTCVATHSAFLGIGLRNALPFFEKQLRMQVAGLLPLAVAVVAGVYLDRGYGRGARLLQSPGRISRNGSSMSASGSTS